MGTPNSPPDESQNNPSADPPWIHEPTKEPLSIEMQKAMREDLKRDYHEARRTLCRDKIWLFMKRPEMYLFDPTLAPQLKKAPGYYTILCNKPTTLYWLASANYKDCTMVPSACIHKQWFHCYDLMPDFDFGHYFANVIRVPSKGPDSISSLLRIHASICAQVFSIHDQLKRGETPETERAYGKWPDAQNYKPIPLFRSIIAVFDRNGDSDGFVNIKEEIHRLTLLLILTGDTTGLSAPISFESIRADSLPLEPHALKIDCDVSMVRVTLGTAVKFITDLEKRELAAYPEIRGNSVDTSYCPRLCSKEFLDVTDNCITNADDWADIHLRKAEEVGIDNCHKTYQAIRRIKAALGGEVWPQVEGDSWLGRTAEGTYMGAWE
ncbi:hypothetical protein FQN54_000096 [Arachnomyces sp. PD_36]|nr:hypothetical protein FQN54_000096 [Arachnomyces sp. PD_36]